MSEHHHPTIDQGDVHKRTFEALATVFMAGPLGGFSIATGLMYAVEPPAGSLLLPAGIGAFGAVLLLSFARIKLPDALSVWAMVEEAKFRE